MLVDRVRIGVPAGVDHRRSWPDLAALGREVRQAVLPGEVRVSDRVAFSHGYGSTEAGGLDHSNRLHLGPAGREGAIERERIAFVLIQRCVTPANHAISAHPHCLVRGECAQHWRSRNRLAWTSIAGRWHHDLGWLCRLFAERPSAGVKSVTVLRQDQKAQRKGFRSGANHAAIHGGVAFSSSDDNSRCCVRLRSAIPAWRFDFDHQRRMISLCKTYNMELNRRGVLVEMQKIIKVWRFLA